MTAGPAGGRSFGPWVFKAFTLLAKAKRLRGTWADPFGWTEERCAERALRDEYLETVEMLCTRLDPNNLKTAIALATLPQDIRGYGPVKLAAMERATKRRTELLQELDRNRFGRAA